MKKCVLWFIACVSLFGFSFAQVNLNPVYTSDRFQPSDKFHAGCENQVDVVFSLPNSKINWLNAILEYNGDDVEILRILVAGEKENNLSYTVENDKIIFSKLKSKWDWLESVIFSLFFKVWINLQESDFSFAKWSYVVDSRWNMVELQWDYNFQFSQVPECDPDIVAPSVELVFPIVESWDFVALDTYFQFEIDDVWKWVNNDSIRVQMGGLDYTLQGIEHIRNGKILTIYPDFWMPFNTGFALEISVSDKQSYGKPNTTTKIYEFQTSDELNLLNDIDPVQFRKIANMGKSLRWTSGECQLLSEMYLNLENDSQSILETINDKLDCGEMEIVKDTWNLENLENLEENNIWKDFSVFGMLGWILFGNLALFMVFWRLKK